MAFVLCVAVTDNLASAEFKLYRVDAQGGALPAQDPTPILAPTTVVQLDARRLLGIPTARDLPPKFPDPVEIDLYAVLVDAQSRLG